MDSFGFILNHKETQSPQRTQRKDIYLKYGDRRMF